MIGGDGREHAVLAEGRCRIRLDVASGSLRGGPVVLRYRLSGVAALRPRILPLRQLLALCSHRRFVMSLFPPDPKMGRFVDALRVHDALVDGASTTQIVEAFYGTERAMQDGDCGSDSLKSRIRRLIREARAMAAGKYCSLLGKEVS
ncbi:DUF2285 domain-containing protein (plasmid) [Novosphingobium sp. BL-8A]|uniref:DNA -binding domain-containing protein n=1 Tax=Novosphingobium sp. BL-8A TaxID=3127639 RepID=UPI00375811C9